MSWITFVWALVIGACAVMALPHLFIGLKNRAWANLFFVLAALSVAGSACGELAIMNAGTIEEIGRALQWTHVPIFFLVLAIIGFVRSYFASGRLWLGLAACGARLVSLVINFAYPPNLNFREITGVRQLDFLGDTVATPQGIISQWTRLGELSSLLLLIFVIDASLTLWRRGSAGDRRRAAVVGGSITLFIILAAGITGLIHTRVLDAPYIISIPFLGVVLAMGFELSYDIVRAAETARQLRASEASLRESEVRMNLAASAANLGLWVWNIQRDEIWITREGRTLFGFGESEPLNLERFLKAIHEEDRSRMEGLIRTSFTEGGEYEREYRVALPNGERRWVAGYGRVELDERGQPAFIRGVTRDITLRKRAETSLRQSEARLSAAIEVAALGLYELRFGVNAYLDDRARSLLGIPRDQDSRALDYWAEHVHPDDREQMVELQRQLSEGEMERIAVEYRFFHPERGLVWLHELAHVMEHDSNKQATLQIGVFQDITERKQAELEKQQLQHEIAHVGRVSMMGQLASALAHEINQPLGAILRNAEAAELFMKSETPDLDEIRAILADIRRDDQRAGNIIDGMRAMLKRHVLDIQLLDMAELVRNVTGIARSDAATRQVKLNVNLPADLPQVRGDRVHLQQVLLNLILNGMDALNKESPPNRRVTVSARAKDKRTLEIAVSDTGHGIGAEQLAHVFDPFFTTKLDGMGMGLPISRTIIEAHGGRLWAENNNGSGGATFRFTLPRALEAAFS